MKLKDLSGERFGRWLVLEVATASDARSYVRWKCLCDCGNIKFVARTSLQSGDSQSCGCLRKDTHIPKLKTHGLSRTVEYVAWKNMMSRCNNPQDRAYANYGGRGIKVCESWYSFESFLADMGKRPEGMTLERDNNDANYSKENCRWASRQEQQRNTRRNVCVTVGGVARTISEWEAMSGLSRGTITYRLNQGCPADKAVTITPKPGRKLPTTF